MSTSNDADGGSPAQLGHVRIIVRSWADLVLDEENPRMEDGGGTTRELINALLDLDAAKQLNIARDIAESGTLSPFELPGVVVEDGLYVVVEGNRRIAALKMLKSPDLIDDAAIRKRVEGIIAANGTGPDEVTCSLFESREDSKRWIELRHTGENEGRGLSPWTTDMSERFNPTPGSQTGLAIQLRDLMVNAYPEDSALLGQLTTIFRGGHNTAGARVRRRATTLGRLIAPKQMQAAFGYTIDRGTGTIRVIGPEAAVHAAFRQIIFDVSEGLTARDINDQTLIGRYIEGISDLKMADQQPGPVPSGTPAGTPGRQAPSASPGPAGGGQQSPTPTPPALAPQSRRRQPRQERFIFQGLRLTRFTLRTSETLGQAQKLEIDSMPLVAGVMLRVVVELCVTQAIEKLNLTVSGKPTLRRKLAAVLKHLDPQIEHTLQRSKRLEPAWINSQNDDGGAHMGLGVDMMNAFVHSISHTAGPSDVRALSQHYRPLLEDLDNAMA